jgi:hypothetical protein
MLKYVIVVCVILAVLLAAINTSLNLGPLPNLINTSLILGNSSISTGQNLVFRKDNKLRHTAGICVFGSESSINFLLSQSHQTYRSNTVVFGNFSTLEIESCQKCNIFLILSGLCNRPGSGTKYVEKAINTIHRKCMGVSILLLHANGVKMNISGRTIKHYKANNHSAILQDLIHIANNSQSSKADIRFPEEGESSRNVSQLYTCPFLQKKKNQNTFLGKWEAVYAPCTHSKEVNFVKKTLYFNTLTKSRIKHIFVVGDSISEGYVKHLACILYNLFPYTTEYFRVNCVGDTCERVRRESGISRCYTFKGHGQNPTEILLCWLSSGKAFGESLATTLQQINASFVNDNKLVIYNVGIHLDTPRATKQLLAATQYIEKFKDKNNYVFRETTPQFFDSKDGTYPRRNPSSNFCRAHKLPMNSTYAPQIDLLVSKKMRFWNVHSKLQTFSPLDAQALHTPAGTGRSILDCSHPCIFGESYYYFDELLFSEISQKRDTYLKKKKSLNVRSLLSKLGMVQMPLQYLYNFRYKGGQRFKSCFFRSKYEIKKIQ